MVTLFRHACGKKDIHMRLTFSHNYLEARILIGSLAKHAWMLRGNSGTRTMKRGRSKMRKMSFVGTQRQEGGNFLKKMPRDTGEGVARKSYLYFPKIYSGNRW